MTMPDSLRNLADERNGVITTAQAGMAGISRERLRQLANAGVLERLGAGVYITPDAAPDKLFIAQTQKPKLIYSHETALYLHDLTDRDPIGYSVTVPRGYNAASLSNEGFTVYTVKRDLHEMGTSQVKTIFGNIVTAYGLERTICDCIRSKNQMDIAIVTDAVKRYARRRDKNLNVLMQMAETFRVVKPLKNYLEVLL